jgi:hypothetical protein
MESIRLVIELDSAGGLRLEGPIHNKILSLGLIALAQHAIASSAEQPERKILPVHAIPPPPRL